MSRLIILSSLFSLLLLITFATLFHNHLCNIIFHFIYPNMTSHNDLNLFQHRKLAPSKPRNLATFYSGDSSTSIFTLPESIL